MLLLFILDVAKCSVLLLLLCLSVQLRQLLWGPYPMLFFFCFKLKSLKGRICKR